MRTQTKKSLCKSFREEHGIEQAEWSEYLSPYPSLLIDNGTSRVLVDAGAGKLGPDTGKLIERLRKTQVEPEDIDIVIFTHIHPDHVGGAVDSDGEKTFRNARYVCAKREWDFWEWPTRPVEDAIT